MSKKKSDKQTPVPSTSRELVRVGAKHIQVTKHGGKRTEDGKKPSTERALILRNGKYGSQGTGEMVLSGKISGREKLDLLAEDLINQSRAALMSPLNIKKCIKIADSQLNAYLDDISNLQDPELFRFKIEEEVKARTAHNSQWNEVDASQIAVTIATRIHNSYMVASAWKVILDMLRTIEKSGLSAKNAQGQLKKDETLRSRYLALLDIVKELVEVEQKNFSALAKNAPHYQRYFSTMQGVKEGEPEVAFEWGSIKDACRSFLDSIMVELCFPRAPYPRRILYAILHDAIDESPWEAKRFPQLLWDAVGELSVTLELQELLESPLLGPEGQKIKEYPHHMPEAYESWLDAQVYSSRTLAFAESFQNLAFPLEKTQNGATLQNVWKMINENYKAVCGENLDTVWHLEEALTRTPQWTAIFVPRALRSAWDEGDPEVAPGSLVKSRKPKPNALTYKKSQKKMLAITDGRAEESDDSMPSLQSVSDSSDESDWGDNSESESDEDEEAEDWYDDEDESGYDSDQEEAMKGMLREAMDTAMAIPEFFDPKTEVPEFEALAEEKKGNPFLKLLGSLRGRMFSSDSTLSSTTRTEPRSGLFRKKPTAASPAPKPSQKPAPKPYQLGFDLSKIPEDELPPLPPIPGPRKKRVPQLRPAPSDTGPTLSIPEQPQNQKATVEEVEDEDAASTTKKKKKKKSKKKKGENAGLDVVVEEGPVPAPAPSPPAPTQKSVPSKATSSPVSSPAKSPAKKMPPFVSSASASMASLSLERTSTVQSGRSYLAGKDAPKEKIKSRPGHASLFSDTKGFLKRDGKEKADDEPRENKKRAWFGNLGKKTTTLMHQLLNTSQDQTKGIKPMKWENFVKVMLEMGFTYDPSTAGSSVRFDPPGGGDRSISFHKPHPDTTIYPIKLKEWSKKLKDYYGWVEQDILIERDDE